MSFTPVAGPRTGHVSSEPAILYFGTPVVLVSTCNPDGSPNLAPISSIFWLGWRCMIGISALSRTTENLLRDGACVLNLPSVNEVDAVDALALTTGSDPVPERKAARGYRTMKDKFSRAGLTEQPSETVAPPRVAECPVQLEAKLVGRHDIGSDDPSLKGAIVTMELRMTRVHLAQHILMEGAENRVDPDRWRPLIMSFQRFYGLGPEAAASRLASIPEALYRSPDVDRARAEPRSLSTSGAGVTPDAASWSDRESASR